MDKVPGSCHRHHRAPRVVFAGYIPTADGKYKLKSSAWASKRMQPGFDCIIVHGQPLQAAIPLVRRHRVAAGRGARHGRGGRQLRDALLRRPGEQLAHEPEEGHCKLSKHQDFLPSDVGDC